MTQTGTLQELNVQDGDKVKHSDGEIHPIKMINGRLCVTSDVSDWSLPVQSSTMAIWQIYSRASDIPKTWRDMTDAEKGALLLAWQQGKVIEWHADDGTWHPMECDPFEWDMDAYRVRPEPKRETVTIRSWEVVKDVLPEGWKIVFEYKDGILDADSIRFEVTK